MKLFQNGSFVLDTWRRATAEDSEQTIRQGGIIVPLRRWRELVAAGIPASGLGVELDAGEAEDRDLARLAEVRLIVVRLAKFTDGRAYSLASRLREVYGFTGELRATGDVLLDQLSLLSRCGFDAFEIAHPATIHALAAGRTPALAVAYQPSYHNGDVALRPTLLRFRGAGEGNRASEEPSP